MKLAQRAFYDGFLTKLAEESHSCGCIMAYLGPKTAKAIKDWINTNVQKSDLKPGGAVANPHVTVKYGILTNDEEVLARELRTTPVRTIVGKIGDVSLFKQKDQDILKLTVHSSDFRAYNKKLTKNIDVIDTGYTYTPHITLAYLKKGTGSKYTKLLNPFKGKEIKFTALIYSDKDGNLCPLSIR